MHHYMAKEPAGMIRRQRGHGVTEVLHKCFGTQGSQMSYNDFHNKEKGCNISSHPREQFDSLVVFNKNVGFKKPRVSWYQESNLEIPFETKKCNYCQILTRVSGCRSRQGIQAY